jgi:hypothetical protein
MADYSLVRDGNGQVCGLWLREEINAQDQNKLAALLALNGAGHLMEKSYRTVPNKADSNGGCFVVFGDAKAPGEQAVGHFSPATKSKKPWWKFWG